MSIPKILDIARNSASTEYVDAKGALYNCTVDETAFAEIETAYKEGKLPVCYYQDCLYVMSYYEEGFYISFTQIQNSPDSANNTIKGFVIYFGSANWQSTVYTSPRITTSIYTDDFDTNISSSIGYYRPIRISSEEPTASVGNIGDIWIQYEE